MRTIDTRESGLPRAITMRVTQVYDAFTVTKDHGQRTILQVTTVAYKWIGHSCAIGALTC